MSSTAYAELLLGLAEVETLQKANPSPTGAAPIDPSITRVVGRASLVLLSSHFERFHYAVAEEIVGYLKALALTSDRYPRALKLEHSRSQVDKLAETEWTRRAAFLEQFASGEACLWRTGAQVTELDHLRLLESMKAPSPKALVRVYSIWNIPDAFKAVTRKSHTRSALWLSIDELVRKRNDIAHGDLTVEATQSDVRRYRQAVRDFCDRLDRKLAPSVARTFGCDPPW